MGTAYFYFSIFVASFGSFIGGTVMGWSSPMTEQLKKVDDNPLGRSITTDENSWLASLSILGTCSGCVITGILSSHIGRKPILFLTGTILLVFYLVMAYAQSIWLLYIGRFMTGSGSGGILSTLPLYYAEISEAKSRGMVSTTMSASMNSGILLSLAAGPHLPYFVFHISLAALAGLFCITLWLFLPESPYFLMKTDRSEAKRILQKMRGVEDVDETLDQIATSLLSVTDVTLKEIIQSKAAIKSITIAFGCYTFTELIGMGVFLSYTQTILQKAGGSISPEDGPVIINIVQCLAALIIPAYADSFSRKSLLIVSHTGIVLSQLPFGIYLYLKFHNYSVDTLSYLPLVCLMLILTLYTACVSPVLLTILGEIFPPRIKNTVVSWMLAYNMIGGFTMTLLYNRLEDAIGLDKLMFIAAFFGILAVLFVKFCLFETRGKTLQEIQKELNSSK